MAGHSSKSMRREKKGAGFEDGGWSSCDTKRVESYNGINPVAESSPPNDKKIVLKMEDFPELFGPTIRARDPIFGSGFCRIRGH
jgi:hypothetical protein